MGHSLDAHTFPELLGKRYDSTFLQTAGGVLIFLAMPLYAGSVIIGGVQFVSQTLHIPYEVALLFFVAVGALYVKRASRAAAVACFISGVSVSLFWLLFIHAKEAVPLGLCKALFGVPSLFPALANVDAIIIALPVSACVYAATTLFTPPVDEKIVEKAFHGIENA